MRGRTGVIDTYTFKGLIDYDNVQTYMWFEQAVPNRVVPDNFMIQINGRPHSNLYFKFYKWDTGLFHNEPGVWDAITGSVPSQWLEVLVRDMKLVEELYDR